MLVQDEEAQNEELLNLSRQILDLTREIHKLSSPKPGTAPGQLEPDVGST